MNPGILEALDERSIRHAFGRRRDLRTANEEHSFILTCDTCSLTKRAPLISTSFRLRTYYYLNDFSTFNMLLVNHVSGVFLPVSATMDAKPFCTPVQFFPVFGVDTFRVEVEVVGKSQAPRNTQYYELQFDRNEEKWHVLSSRPRSTCLRVMKVTHDDYKIELQVPASAVDFTYRVYERTNLSDIRFKDPVRFRKNCESNWTFDLGLMAE